MEWFDDGIGDDHGQTNEHGFDATSEDRVNDFDRHGHAHGQDDAQVPEETLNEVRRTTQKPIDAVREMRTIDGVIYFSRRVTLSSSKGSSVQ